MYCILVELIQKSISFDQLSSDPLELSSTQFTLEIEAACPSPCYYQAPPFFIIQLSIAIIGFRHWNKSGDDDLGAEYNQ